MRTNGPTFLMSLVRDAPGRAEATRGWGILFDAPAQSLFARLFQNC